MYKRYGEANPTDELARWLQGESWWEWRGKWCGPAGPQRHHIFAPPRYDKWWNLITVDACTHDYIHRLCPKEGAVAAVFVKVLKSEWDQGAARATLGFDPVGFMENWLADGVIEDWCHEMVRTIVKNVRR